MAFEDFVITRLAGWGVNLTVRIECDPFSSHWVKLGLAVRVAHANGASLDGASLDGALYYDKKIKRIFACAGRTDGHVFYAFEVDAGAVYIKAGCRWFTPAEFRAHIVREYPDTDKALETGRILDLIEGRMADLGIGVEKPKRARKVAS